MIRCVTVSILFAFVRQAEGQARIAVPLRQTWLKPLSPSLLFPSQTSFGPLRKPPPLDVHLRQPLLVQAEREFKGFGKPPPSKTKPAAKKPSSKTRAPEKTTKTVYNIESDRCGEAEVPGSTPLSVFEGVTGMKSGSCRSQGYTELTGTKKINVPFADPIEVTYFKKKELPKANYKPSELFIHTFPGFISIAAMVLVALFACSGVAFAAQRFRHGASTAGEEPLLAT